MGCYRFFIDVERFEVGAEVVLEGSEALHARRVMRVDVGDRVTLVNGKGWLADARAEAIEKKRVRFQVFCCREMNRPSRQLWLGLGNLRSNHLDFAIEKGVEVGVDHFVLFVADGSEIREFSEAKKRRMCSLIQSAVKQCGRIFSPTIQTAQSIDQALQILPGPFLWAHISDDAVPLFEELSRCDKEGGVSLCIGPEKGWSHRERALLCSYGKSVALHENILRAETAAIVGAYEIAQWFSS